MVMHDSIAGFFVSALPPAPGALGQTAAEPREFRFAMMGEGTRGAPDPDRCRETLASLPPGGYVAVALVLPDGSRFQRMTAALTLPFRLAAAERALRRRGVEPAGRYGVSPDLCAPTVLYQLESAAARYAEKYLLLSPRSLLSHAICGVLRLWAGLDPSLGAVLVVGRKP